MDLGLQTSGCRISWFGQRGMTWKQFTPAVGSYLDRHPSPGMILIQVGSNDLGSTKGFELVHDIECDLLRLRVLLPDVKLYGVNCCKGGTGIPPGRVKQWKKLENE